MAVLTHHPAHYASSSMPAPATLTRLSWSSRASGDRMEANSRLRARRCNMPAFVILNAHRFIGIEVITANEFIASKYPLQLGELMDRLHGRHSLLPTEGEEEPLSSRQAAVERQWRQHVQAKRDAVMNRLTNKFTVVPGGTPLSIQAYDQLNHNQRKALPALVATMPR